MERYLLFRKNKVGRQTYPNKCQWLCREGHDSHVNDLNSLLGTLLAIMGPSGCGKTTLLDILSRRLKADSVTGTQLLGGSTFESSTLRAISTYVEQEDHLIGSLTVQETVEFAAKLALPAMNAQQRRERTVHLLRDFGLLDVKDSKIGTPLQRGISGGQKRRVTTASQLITLPKIIFLGTTKF